MLVEPMGNLAISRGAWGIGGLPNNKELKITELYRILMNAKLSSKVSNQGKRVRWLNVSSLYLLGSGVSNLTKGTSQWLCAIKIKAG